MAVGPLQLPQYQQAGDLNWAPLAEIGKTLQTNNINNQRKEALSLSALGQGGAVDYGKAANTLASLGDIEGASKFAAMQKALSPESTPDIQNYNYAAKNPAFLPYLKQQAEAKATKINTPVNVNTGGGSDKQIFDSVDESAKLTRAAATGLAGLREARNALDSGIISGAGANEILGLQKIGAQLGLASPEKIQNTETFRAAIAPQVAAMIKSTVGNANISNSDREFAEKAAGGNITLDAGSIRRLVDIMERAGSATVNAHNSRLDAIYPDNGKFKRERALFGIPAVAKSTRLKFNPSSGMLE